MNKKIYISFIVLFLSMGFAFLSCSDDDDDTGLDEEWIDLNESRFNEEKNSGQYELKKVEGIVEEILMKPSTVITDSDEQSAQLKIDNEGYPHFTDTVMVRYTGWYYNKNNEKYIFDSTEEPVTGSTVWPNKLSRKMAVADVIGGMQIAFQNMKEGDERQIVIPWKIGYGINGDGEGTIPGFTTLYFNLKVMKIYPMKIN